MSDQKQKYETAINREQELQKQRQEQLSKQQKDSDSKEKLPYRTLVTGLLTGEITDIEYTEQRFSDDYLELTVLVSTGDEITVPVKDTGEYKNTNELVRLIEWKNILNQEFGNLIGENITLRITGDGYYYRQNKSVDQYNWEVYLPQSLDIVDKSLFRLDNIMARGGVQHIDRISEEMTWIDLALLPFVGVWFFLIYLFLFSGILDILGILGVTSGAVSIMVLLAPLLFAPSLLRFGHEAFEKYKDYRKNNDVV